MSDRKVVLTSKFRADAIAAFDWLWERNPAAAQRFRAMIEKAVLGLDQMAERHASAEEFEGSGRDVRRALVGKRVKWRLFFEINGDTVTFLHIRHGARDIWTG